MRVPLAIFLICVVVTVCLLLSSGFVGESPILTVCLPWMYISVWCIGAIFAIVYRNESL